MDPAIDPSISLNAVTRLIQHALGSGELELASLTQTLLTRVVMIEIAIMGMFVAVGSNRDAAFYTLLKKGVILSILTYCVGNFGTICDTVLRSFLYLGSQSVKTNLPDPYIYQNPDKLFALGYDAVLPVIEGMARSGLTLGFIPGADTILTTVMVLIILAAFAILAIQVFVTYLEFVLLGTLGVVLVPLAVFSLTRPIAERLFGSILNFGIKMMILSCVSALAYGMMHGDALRGTGFRHTTDLALVSCALCFLALHATSVVSSMLNGVPSLAFGHAVAAGASLSRAVSTTNSTVSQGSHLAQAGYRGAVSALGTAAGVYTSPKPIGGGESRSLNATPQMGDGLAPRDLLATKNAVNQDMTILPSNSSGLRNSAHQPSMHSNDQVANGISAPMFNDQQASSEMSPLSERTYTGSKLSSSIENTNRQSPVGINSSEEAYSSQQHKDGSSPQENNNLTSSEAEPHGSPRLSSIIAARLREKWNGSQTVQLYSLGKEKGQRLRNAALMIDNKGLKAAIKPSSDNK